jgi:hypothetical protein
MDIYIHIYIPYIQWFTLMTVIVRLGNRHRALDFERRSSAAISSALRYTGKSGFDSPFLDYVSMFLQSYFVG